MNAGWIYLMFPTRDIIWKKQTDVCLFRFWARGQQFKINHTETVPFTNFGAKRISILYDSFALLGVFFSLFSPFNFISSV